MVFAYLVTYSDFGIAASLRQNPQPGVRTRWIYWWQHNVVCHRFCLPVRNTLYVVFITLMVAQARLTSARPVASRAGILPPSGLPPKSVRTPVVALYLIYWNLYYD